MYFLPTESTLEPRSKVPQLSCWDLHNQLVKALCCTEKKDIESSPLTGERFAQKAKLGPGLFPAHCTPCPHDSPGSVSSFFVILPTSHAYHSGYAHICWIEFCFSFIPPASKERNKEEGWSSTKPLCIPQALCKVCILFISMVSVISILLMGKLDLEELRFVSVSEL